jgi:hypothetical protein
MSHWIDNYPGTTLDRVLDNICDEIDNSKGAGEVLKFAKDVVHWVSKMQLAFESRREGQFRICDEEENAVRVNLSINSLLVR